MNDVSNDITARLDEARKHIDWSRRREAEKSLLNWLSTYGIGVFIDDKPDGHLPEVVNAIEGALKTARPYQILMPRKHGKTSYVAGAAAYLMVTGQCKFLAVIGANREAAKDILGNIFLLTENEVFAEDYPDVVVPIVAANGASKRRITYMGKPCKFEKNATHILLPTVALPNGKVSPAAGVMIKAFGIKSAIRGQRNGTVRPDVVLIDDVQTKESAQNPRRVKEAFEKITRDIANLSGRQKLRTLIAATVICPNDLAETIKATKAWKTTWFKAFISWPTDFTKHPRDGLWSEYFRIFDSENARDLDNHQESLDYYLANREAMDEGADVLTPSKFDPSQWEASTVQAYMNKIHTDGISSFNAEFQMEPDVGDFALKIAPKDVAVKDAGFAELSVPDGYLHLFASTDLNLSYALTTTIMAYRPDGSAAMVYHETWPSSINGKLNGSAYYSEVVKKLTEYAGHLTGLGLKIDRWAIDCGGMPFNAVTDFAKNCYKNHGIKAVGMRGWAAHKLNLTPRNAIMAAREDCVLVGDAVRLASTSQSPAGREWINWNSDAYRENVHKSLLSALGSVGSLDLYHTTRRSRDDFIIQVTNEKLLTKTENHAGRTEYKWEGVDPHDYLDSTAQNMAIAAFSGIGAPKISRHTSRPRPRRARIACL